MKVYRSVQCERLNGVQGLKKVEILEDEGNYMFFIYDVGFEPPYWDVTRLPAPAFLALDSLEAAIKYATEDRSIKVLGWQVTEEPFLAVSNSVVRDEIRFNLDKDEVYKNFLDVSLHRTAFIDMFDHIIQGDRNKYDGYSVYVNIIFKRSASDATYSPGSEITPHLLSYENVGTAVIGEASEISRNEELRGKNRIVVKGTDDDTSFACIELPNREVKCLVYDQGSRTILNEGLALRVVLNFHQNGVVLIADSTGFSVSKDDTLLPLNLKQQ